MGRMKEIARKLDYEEPLTEIEQKYVDSVKQQQLERLKARLYDFALEDALSDIEELNKIDPPD